MRALVCLGSSVEVQQVADPSPKPGEVVVAVEACGICGSDVHQVEHGASRPGHIMGHELAGHVASLGEGVADWQVGQRVAVNPLGACGNCAWCARELSIRCRNVPNIGLNVPGGFAEYLAVPAAQLVALPPGMSAEQGAHVEPLAVALRSLREAALVSGEDVVVFGAGPIGLNVIAGARALGAGRIVAVEPSAARRAAALAMGAAAAVEPSQVLEAEFDVALECSGAGAALAACVTAVREAGRIVQVAMGRTPSPLPTREFVVKNLCMLSSTAFGPKEFAQAFRLIRDGVVDIGPLVSERIALEQAPEAFVRLRRPEGAVGVLVEPCSR